MTNEATTSQLPSPIEISALTKEIADQLDETEIAPIELISKVIAAIGEEKVRELVQKTFEVQANGGMFLKKQNRNRTTGGVFFYLAAGVIGKSKWNKLNPSATPKKKKKKKNPANASANPTDTNVTLKKKAPKDAPLITEEELNALYTQAATWTPGVATTTKLTLIGRPGKVSLAGNQAKPDNFLYAAFTLEMNKTPALPKGLPLPKTNTKYLVLIGAKQWRKAETELKTDDNNRLLIETYPSINAKVVTGIVGAGISAIINLARIKEGKETIKPEPGLATTTNLLVTGRPSEIKVIKGISFFVLEASKVPPLPTGLPAIRAGTKYLVCTTGKSWDKAAAALVENEEDKVVIEGHPSFDQRFPGVIVSATNVTTMGLQRAKRESSSLLHLL